MRIAFVVNSLRLGGAEKTVAEMANYWAEEEKQITIYSLSNYPVAAGIHLSKKVSLVNVAAPFFSLRRHLRESKPDVVIPFIDQCAMITALVTLGMPVKIIAAERIYPGMHTILKANYSNFLRNLAAALRVQVYKLTSALVVQTEAAKQYFLPTYKNKIFVVPNALFVSDQSDSDTNIPEQTITAIGRLAPQKGFDYLINEFSQIAHKFPDWKLVIFGDGKEKQNLEYLIKSKNLKQQVLLLGETKTPLAVLKKSQIFVLSSRFEGYPNVLCQAMACGCAVIATDCLAGPADIINNGVNGILVKPETELAIADQLEKLIKDPAERKRLGDNARQIVKRLDPKIIMDKWQKIIEQIVNE